MLFVVLSGWVVHCCRVLLCVALVLLFVACFPWCVCDCLCVRVLMLFSLFARVCFVGDTNVFVFCYVFVCLVWFCYVILVWGC